MNYESLNHNLSLSKNRESSLELQLIAEYLRSRGYRMIDLRKLPEEQRKALMQEACMYAAVRLANVEAKAKFKQTIKYP